MRKYCKERVFSDFKHSAEDSMDQLSAQFAALANSIDSKLKEQNEYAKMIVNKKLTHWMSKQSQDRPNITGAEMERIKDLSHNFEELISSKAEASELQEIAKQKTNKADT